MLKLGIERKSEIKAPGIAKPFIPSSKYKMCI